MNKRSTQHIAKALYWLDAAGVPPFGTRERKRLERIRAELSKLFSASGYEFARCDSTLIRKRKPREALRQ